MTRPKRRTPPSSTPKRVSFEIPASLREFSSISRSLATKMATGNLSYTNNASQISAGQLAAHALAAQRPSSQSFTHSAATSSSTPISSQNATSKSIPQKRSFSDYQPSAPSMNAEQSSTLAEVMALARATVAASKAQTGQVPQVSIQPSGARYTKSGDPNMVAQIAARQREQNARARAAKDAPPAFYNEEPPLKIGEAPSLTTHPNLIAQMVARKRAEAEASGSRQHWARQQQEYRLSESPGAQLSHELNAQVSMNDAHQYQPRSISNPLPAQSAPSIPPFKPPTPIVFNAELPAAPRVAPPLLNTGVPTSHPSGAGSEPMPAREDSISTDAARSQRQASNNNSSAPQPSPETDSLFGSPFSSPIVEFLEKATDNAGLKDALEPNRVASTRTSVSAISAPAAHAGNVGTTTPSTSAAKVSRSQAQSEVPALFSDRPLNIQTQSGVPSATQVRMEVREQQLEMHPVVKRTNTKLPWKGQGVLQLVPRKSPAPKAVPYYPQQAGMPGYYRVEAHRNWLPGTAPYGPYPPSAQPHAYLPPPQPYPGMAYNGYVTSPVHPYTMPQPGLPPAPGPLQTYGTVVASAPTGQKSTAEGFTSAAELVGRGKGGFGFVKR